MSWVVFRDVMYFFLLLVLSVEVQISVCLKDIHVLSIWCGVSTVPTDPKMHHVHHLTILASDLTLKWWINSDDKKTHILYIYIHIGRFFLTVRIYSTVGHFLISYFSLMYGIVSALFVPTSRSRHFSVRGTVSNMSNFRNWLRLAYFSFFGSTPHLVTVAFLTVYKDFLLNMW